jgi:carboxyl-terminal processing protease
LAIYRKQNDSVFWVNLKRGAVPLKSVDASYMINQNVGYIKINRFSQTTFVEFDRALRLLQLTGLQSLVIDLRDNPGGYLLPATQIADTFLSAGTPIVITQSNKGQRQETQATDQGNFEKGGLYILVNEQSASASEILAGAVQDNDRGWVVGRRTFGKGLVQQQMPLGDGDAVRLTTARYYTPTGRSIQRPYDNDHEAYYAEVTERYERGEMEDQTKIPQNDSLAYTTPKGRTVYGGGGIHPDLFVPNNNTQEEEWDSFVLRSNVINHFVFVTLDANRGEYAFGSASEFLATPLTTPEVWLDKFQAYCTQNSIPFAFKDQDKILTAIKAYIGLQVYGEGVFTQILNTDDPFLRKVMDHLALQLD